ncbi:hypothetical protein JCM16418A_16600 [Paenibacillus pini]
MFKCKQCGSAFLKPVDALKCSSVIKDKPLIRVGRILIDNSYDSQTKIRCYAIKPKGHELVYYFEWQGDTNTNRWSPIYTYGGNKFLLEIFSEQIHRSK